MIPGPGKSLSVITGLMLAWIVITLLVPLGIILVVLSKGRAALDLLIIEGPFSYLPLTLTSVTITWLLIGLFLILFRAGKINHSNLLTWAGFLFVAFLYLNILRDRLDYGDVQPYLRAADSLLHHRSFGHTYVYPPLWAILLQPLVELGRMPATNILFVFNILALSLSYFLGASMLQRYGGGERPVAVIMTAFMLVNVPILRTMFYMQINLYVLDFIFLSLLLRRRSAFLSALAMAIAIHLKFAPAILVLAFLLQRDWRWLIWLAVTTFAIFGLTLLTNGLLPYTDFLYNIGLLNQPFISPAFRDTSFDSLLWPLRQLLHISDGWIQILIYACKAGLAAGVFLVIYRTIKHRSLYTGEMPSLFNAVPALMILMNMASPLVWEHHGVFLILPFLLLLKRLATPAEWAWFGAAYFFEFFLPTFDFYPWSYGRLAATLIVLVLLWVTGKRHDDTPLFSSFSSWLEALPRSA